MNIKIVKLLAKQKVYHTITSRFLATQHKCKSTTQTHIYTHLRTRTHTTGTNYFCCLMVNMRSPGSPSICGSPAALR